MTINEAEEIVGQLTDFYGRKKLTTTALKFWCRGLVGFNRRVADRALQDVWDSYATMPTRQAFLQAAYARQAEMSPKADPGLADIEKWEADLGAAVMPHLMRYLSKGDDLQAWGNNFRAVARQLGVEDRIDWEQWEGVGVRFYV